LIRTFDGSLRANPTAGAGASASDVDFQPSRLTPIQGRDGPTGSKNNPPKAENHGLQSRHCAVLRHERHQNSFGAIDEAGTSRGFTISFQEVFVSSSISRRMFLKGGLAAAVGAVATAVPGAQALAAADDRGYVATLIDIRKCIGCEACVQACREASTSKFPEPQKPFPKMYPSRVKVSDWSEKRDVDDRLTPYNWLFIQHATVRINGEDIDLTLPRRCMHCVNPPCVKLCPWGSAKQLENGISRIDPDICLGGSKCKNVCPWDVPQRQTGVGLYLDLLPSLAGNGVMYKCDRCYDRIARGELPACIEACPEEVQTIGPRQDIIAKAHVIAKEIGGYVYGENENGGTNTIYVSPVPFEELNQATTTGDGRPHLKPVHDAMADANHLAAAMVIAPVAGLATAAARFLINRSKGEPHGNQEEAKNV
jgi:Fe-S-cluster-containing dehydrogenase component